MPNVAFVQIIRKTYVLDTFKYNYISNVIRIISHETRKIVETGFVVKYQINHGWSRTPGDPLGTLWMAKGGPTRQDRQQPLNACLYEECHNEYLREFLIWRLNSNVLVYPFKNNIYYFFLNFLQRNAYYYNQ